MNTNEILALYDEDERIHASAPGMRREVDGPVVRLVMEAEAEGLSYISYSSLNEANADEAIARQIAYFQVLGSSFEWTLFGHDNPPNLGQHLVAAGFEKEETGALLALALAGAPPRLLAPITADIRQVTKISELETVRALLQTVWDEPFAWFIPRMSRYLAPNGYVSIYLAFIDGRPASTAWAFFPQGSRFVGLFGGSTLEAYRGRGLYTALLAARVQEAKRRGRQFLHVDAGEMSRPILQKQGFVLLTETTPYMWQQNNP